jgi:xanthine dehydrogenase accessory factor
VRDLLDELVTWSHAGRPFALATVVRTIGSAPRPAGAALAVDEDGQVLGSVSGGCVEGAVYELCQEVLASGRPVLTRYGVSNDTLFEVGLTCGGTLDVYVERIEPTVAPDLDRLSAAIHAAEPVATATVVRHPDPRQLGRRFLLGPTIPAESGHSDRLDAVIQAEANDLLRTGRSELRSYSPEGSPCGDDVEVFIAAHTPPPRMIVFGAIDFAAAMVRVGKLLGYHVTVCDARPVFTTRARFPDADEVVASWPHRYLAAEAANGRVDARTALVVLTHDPKFDGPLLETALRLPAIAYVGAMGSRRTHHDRVQALQARGCPPAAIARLRSPIGLDLGAHTPEETAISIAAEILAAGTGRSGLPLSATTGSIHDAGEAASQSEDPSAAAG